MHSEQSQDIDPLTRCPQTRGVFKKCPLTRCLPTRGVLLSEILKYEDKQFIYLRLNEAKRNERDDK